MCELFAMSSRKPSAVSYSLPAFAERGSYIRRSREGWGIAYGHDEDVFLIKEAKPAADSPWVQFAAEQHLESHTVIAHVRHATIGKPVLQNTHPFRYVAHGRVHVFAHNGTLTGLSDRYPKNTMRYKPIGQTDSEHAFCLMLERLDQLEEDSDLNLRQEIIAEFTSEMTEFGAFNFLYYDGTALYAHAHRRVYEENGQFTDPKPPGLQMKNCQICAAGPEITCDGLNIQHAANRTILIASVPLDEIGWEPLPEGVLLVLKGGEEIGRLRTCTP
ncbi:MAG: class II glutamine amidotransferase [Desulforhopalus sp.]